MKEQDLIKIIQNNIGSDYIGDDCAYLRDIGIVVSQDNFVEDIHFKREWYTPFQLGYKAMAVNISDILASGAKPTYVTIALSLPKDISKEFVDEFYKGAISVLHGAKIVGGDITGSDKIFISITAIGSDKGRRISSRSNAKIGYKVISKGKFGESTKGLQELLSGGNSENLIEAHLMPILDEKFSKDISEYINVDYAMMDTSDGLADALFKIAEASNVSIEMNYVEGMFGAEDFKLVAAVPESFISKLDNVDIITTILEKKDYTLKIDNKTYTCYDDLQLYNHFGG